MWLLTANSLFILATLNQDKRHALSTSIKTCVQCSCDLMHLPLLSLETMSGTTAPLRRFQMHGLFGIDTYLALWTRGIMALTLNVSRIAPKIFILSTNERCSLCSTWLVEKSLQVLTSAKRSWPNLPLAFYRALRNCLLLSNRLVLILIGN